MNDLINSAIPSLDLYLNDFDKVPRIHARNIDEVIFHVVLGLFSRDEYVVKVSLEYLNSYITTREDKNGQSIKKTVSKLLCLTQLYTINSYEFRYDLIRRFVIKLIVSICSPYSNSNYFQQRKIHMAIAHEFVKNAVNKLSLNNSLLVGSLFKGSDNWHPWFSDIDIIFITETPLKPCILENLYELYYVNSPTDKYPWIYVNYGGKKGIGNLQEDPYKRMFNVKGLNTIDNVQLDYLCSLFNSPAKILHQGGKTLCKYYHKLYLLSKSIDNFPTFEQVYN